MVVRTSTPSYMYMYVHVPVVISCIGAVVGQLE